MPPCSRLHNSTLSQIHPRPAASESRVQFRDLNLLVVFAVLVEERNVSRAAERLLLSQLAVSRVLQHLRDMFHDEPLISATSGRELTPQGQRLLSELEAIAEESSAAMGYCRYVTFTAKRIR